MHVIKRGAFAYTCISTHVVSVLFVDTVHSSAVLLFQHTAEPRGSAASHLMISSEIKQKYDSAPVFYHWQSAGTSSFIQV